MAKLELKGLNPQELNKELDKTMEQYDSLKYNNAVSSLADTSELKVVRRNIARIKTELRAQELVDCTQKRDKIQKRRRIAKKIKK